jgi:antirestriction protein
MTESPKIYVACLAAYNNGKLHGDYIEANKGVEHIWDGIKKVLATSPIKNAEEWAIHDYENFGSISISEMENIEKVAELAEFVEEHGELGTEVLSYYGNDLDQAKEMLEDNYHGSHRSLADFAQSFIEETHDLSNVPQIILYHTDWEAVARDLFIDDFIDFEVNGDYHVFTRA